MIKSIENKLKFIELMDEMKNIQRAIKLKNWRKETNAEHSFHLAMMVTTFINDFPDLDFNKCLKMSIYHDLVEIFAWDTVIFDVKMEKTKHIREAKALIQLEEVLWKSDFKKIKIILIEYEERKTLESQFVWQLDKVQPIIQQIMEGWSTWHEFKIEKNKLMEKKYSQVDGKFWFDKILDYYFDIAENKNLFYIK